jgi:hypothetical protein
MFSGLDFLVVGLIALLARLSLADVIYLNLNLRERAAEIVTLRTVGWSETYLARVIAGEAVVLGALGSGSGAALGFVIGVQLGVPVFPLLGGIGRERAGRRRCRARRLGASAGAPLCTRGPRGPRRRGVAARFSRSRRGGRSA